MSGASARGHVVLAGDRGAMVGVTEQCPDPEDGRRGEQDDGDDSENRDR